VLVRKILTASDVSFHVTKAGRLVIPRLQVWAGGGFGVGLGRGAPPPAAVNKSAPRQAHMHSSREQARSTHTHTQIYRPTFAPLCAHALPPNKKNGTKVTTNAAELCAAIRPPVAPPTAARLDELLLDRSGVPLVRACGLLHRFARVRASPPALAAGLAPTTRCV
jgi:hypothetical protein